MGLNKWFISILVALVSNSVVAETSAPKVTCEESHRKAITSCTAHEHAVNAEALTIVSRETRERVAADEKRKLEFLKANCEKNQQSCAVTCDEELETSSLDGSDLTTPLELLNDCRQGEVAQSIRMMRQKLAALKRAIDGRSAANQPLVGHPQGQAAALSPRRPSSK